MKGLVVPRINWQKSSYSSQASNCVELAPDLTPGAIYLRESDDPSTVITTTSARLAAFLTAARSGKLRLEGG
ncbi:DUF397 domain-containing protein [Streptomyces gobiensis]|uniref:DUF397 domain-containing protein n=1 Tax=Streptomyces gobiensis TaxID=2875706 RepID=UPI001E6069E9|nr:DUF397 domain-containing protein [Streptomyces gobiensis]UGY93379.1 DUF397 domain-containing protein [Streptomyces gobiensis]